MILEIPQTNDSSENSEQADLENIDWLEEDQGLSLEENDWLDNAQGFLLEENDWLDDDFLWEE